MKPDEKIKGTSDPKRDFGRGNINFDFLQPEESPESIKEKETGVDESVIITGDKRGIFFKDRDVNPVGSFYLLGWTILFIFSCVTLAWIVFFGKSMLWFLALPFIIPSLLWSLIMLALLKARPR